MILSVPNALRSVVIFYKRVTVSDSLRLLMAKEHRDQFALFHEQIALSLTKNERFAQKRDDQIPNPENRLKLPVLWIWIRIRIRIDPELLPGYGSEIKVPDPDPTKSERAYK